MDIAKFLLYLGVRMQDLKKRGTRNERGGRVCSSRYVRCAIR